MQSKREPSKPTRQLSLQATTLVQTPSKCLSCLSSLKLISTLTNSRRSSKCSRCIINPKFTRTRFRKRKYAINIKFNNPKYPTRTFSTIFDTKSMFFVQIHSKICSKRKT